MSDFRVSRGAPQGVPPEHAGQSPGRAAQPAAGQPTTQTSGQFGPAVPLRPQHAPTVGVRQAQPGKLRQLLHFLNNSKQRSANPSQRENVVPGQPLGQAPVSYSQPYPNGGPGAAQPYAQPYQPTTQPSRARSYVRPALIGGAISAALPTLQLFAALPSGGGGLGPGTLLGYGIPIILRSFMIGAGVGAAVRAVRQRARERRERQQLAWQGQQSGPQMYPMQRPGSMPRPGYAPAPQQPGGYPQAYPGNAGAPQQWPLSQPQSWPPQNGRPASPQPPMPGQPLGTFGPAHPSYNAPAQHPAAQPPTGTFGPPPVAYGAPAPRAQAQQAGHVSSPPVPPQQYNGPAQQPAPTAQRAFPNDTSGAQTAAQALQRFAPEERMNVFNKMLQGLQNYPVVRERAPGFANLAQAIPLLSDDARTPGGRVDEKLVAFRALYAEKKNLSIRGANALHAALREVFGSLTAGAQAAFLRDNKDADFPAPKTV
ncbi:hypothetical protein R75461_05628 [Paraburkholderia nemoris]|nr:hypothetical protein LMG22931_03456 [Paraburkholderia nemoris]CAE6810506.1 hypothetical protein R75461_05628 [Paraburkholderia nemoris]